MFIYKAAKVFVFPSLFEGFGLPLVEARASGVPIVAGEATIIPEIVRDTGLIVPHHDVEKLAKAIYRISSEQNLREELIARVIERAKQFTWEKTAQETLRVIEETSRQ